MRPQPSAIVHFSPSPAQDVLSLPEIPGMSHSLAAPVDSGSSKREGSEEQLPSSVIKGHRKTPSHPDLTASSLFLYESLHISRPR